MRGTPGALLAVIAAVVVALVATPAAARAAAADPDCLNNYGNAPARSGPPLRFGIDPGLAGSSGSAELPTVPDDPAKDLAAVEALRPPHRVLVVRLNRLFWSDGQAGIDAFERTVQMYTRKRFEVEIQVRYHPTQAENGDLAAWTAYVRHVVDTFGPNRRVVAMTITNEVNVTVSPNTSDGSYKDADQALIDGIEAAHAEAQRRHFTQLRFGFTYAYRFSPQGDAALFDDLATSGGRAFRRALGFVGLDFYPGSFYPPTMAGETYRGAMAQALGTLRDCFMAHADLGPTVPIWITEDGVPTGATESGAAQASALSQLVEAAQAYSGTFGVTDYRWFNLRDSNASPLTSLPGAAATFATDGLLTDTYAPKPSFAVYRGLIARFGQRAGRCPARRSRARSAVRRTCG